MENILGRILEVGGNGRDFRLYLANSEKLWYADDSLNRVIKDEGELYGRSRNSANFNK